MSQDTSSEPIGNTPAKLRGDVASDNESTAGGDGGATAAHSAPGSTPVGVAASESAPPDGVPSDAEVAAEHSDDPELARQGGDAKTESL